MGIFRKKSRNLIDIIKYEGSPEVLIWKHDCEDFNTNSQLLVQEGQEAIFIKNGQALASFPLFAAAYNGVFGKREKS